MLDDRADDAGEGDAVDLRLGRRGSGGGARCLGREDAIGSLEVGKLGDVALWRLDGLGHADIADPVCALVFGPPAPLALLLVGGRTIVDAHQVLNHRHGPKSTPQSSMAKRFSDRRSFLINRTTGPGSR